MNKLSMNKLSFLGISSLLLTLFAPCSASNPDNVCDLEISNPNPTVHEWQSKLVKRSPDGVLSYTPDETGNIIPDFSHAGYCGGDRALPKDISVAKTLAPISGDNTAHIQEAIDAVAALPLQPNGYRGTILLSAGIYEVAGTIRISESGIVLAGTGQGADPAVNTIIRRTGTSRNPVILAGGNARGRTFATEIEGTRRQITTERVTVGSYSFELENVDGFRVGDAVLVVRPSTEAWLKSVNYGDAFPEKTSNRTVWKVGEIDLRYHRYISAIAGNKITLDAPVYDHLDRNLSQSYIAKFDATGIAKHIGIEKILVDIEIPEDGQAQTQNCIQFRRAENCWVRNVSTQHFIHAGIQFADGSMRSTVQDCRAVEPRGVATGGNFYNFCVNQAQLILFVNCYASGARHSYISNGCSLDSGIVFLNCVSDQSLDTNEGHRRWAQALLFDNLRVINPANSTAVKRAIGLYNRGNWGTAHGWGAVHSVAWNCEVPPNARIVIQQPPGAQNYAIGCSGEVTDQGPFPSPAGYIEGDNKLGLEPRSLYEAQLKQRTSK